MNSSKRRSRRLALYLLCIEVRPWAAGLQTQYDALEPGQRKLARKTGRRLIKEEGSIAKAIATLTNPVVVQETRIVPHLVSLTRAQAREEAFKYISRRWSALTPPCPSCRMGNGFPKRSWPTREWAEEVWGRQHDLNLLSVYACPVQPGFWHLGHHSEKARKQKELRSGVDLTRPKIEEGRDNQSQTRDEQSNLTEQESLRGGSLTENAIEDLGSLNETTEFGDWISDFDDDTEIDGDCNESQPCRGDEYCDDGYDDLEPTPPPARIRVQLQLWWYPVKGVVRRYLSSRFSWFERKQVNIVKQNDSDIPF
jgi:hypothetical protein